ncbi:MAG: glycosyltransferase family 4 protein, partial [Proteobacteria bacterium]|nr:glycosyltransferase family 4 protein [Pseudomonadota bacterium]
KRPRVLLVTPFAVFPPAHGGARRISEIGRGLAEHTEVLLLSDEASRYDGESHSYFAPYRSIHLIEGRADRPGEPPISLRARVARHAFVRMRAELRRLIAIHRPEIVQLEHMELAALVEERQANEKWVLTLHDVYLDGSGSDAWQKKMLARFDALIACSEEDAALLDHPRVLLVPNGGIDRLDAYSPSPDGPNLLFMGPFRYEPNRQGILAFIRTVFAAIRAACPDATLTILGGAESAAADRSDARFAEPGISLVSKFVDPAPYLAAATLTLNPQVAIRGSALKVVESLLSGRCCVSTVEGARGFTNSGLGGLVLANGVADMADAIIALATDPDRRHVLERPERAAIEPFSWRGSAARQLALYRQLIEQA